MPDPADAPSHTPVLIAGAGPTGLVLALGLARRGVPFRLVDEGAGPGAHSRAMVVQARTLEFYGQFGLADAVVAGGVKAAAVHMRRADAGGVHEVASVTLNELGSGISPFPFALCYPQDDHERFLVDTLRAEGHAVEWNRRLTGFTQDADGVLATVEGPDGQAEQLRADYLCGCDGAHSAVRRALGMGFPGGTYDQLFYVADVRVAGGFNQDLFFSLGGTILALMLPVRSSGMQRLIGLVPPELSDRRDLAFDDIRAGVEQLLDIRVEEVNWFSTYRVHHRVAERFRDGRAFLLGDAGHIHSPVGGQGMNTGIGDAVNLGWKLADVVRNRADPALLDSYEPERIGFARSLVSTTDRVFTPVTAGGLRGELMRRVVAPLVFSVATRFDVTRHALFRTLSQARVHYPDSQLSTGKAGGVHGGDRLPWVPAVAGGEDNFAPLRSLDWQAHVYGQVDDAVAQACARHHLPLHAFPWNSAAGEAGLARDAVYLVRPDGYVGLAAAGGAFVAELDSYCGRVGLRRN